MITVIVADAAPASLEAALAGSSDRRGWVVHFANSPARALELLDEHPDVDVVVANTGALDGLELLGAVRKRSPKAARIIVSELSDSHLLWNSVGAAHHYLTTPVDADELDRVINRVDSSPSIEIHDPVRELIDRTDRLPSPPALFQQIVEMLQSDRWTSDSIADVLSTDVALTTEILRLINSSMFGYSGKVNTVSRAVSLLGIDLIRTLVLGNKLFLPHDDLESWLDLGLLDRRCKSVAAGTYALALRDRASKDAASTAYLTGMVNEVGLLVMGRVPNIGATLAAPLNTRTFPDVERALFGGDRFVVGGRLLQEWGFDGEVVDGVLQMTSPDVADSTGLPWYLYAARQLVLEHGFNHQDLAAPAGAIPAIDDALDAVRNGVEVEVPEPEPVPETV